MEWKSCPVPLRLVSITSPIFLSLPSCLHKSWCTVSTCQHSVNTRCPPLINWLVNVGQQLRWRVPQSLLQPKGIVWHFKLESVAFIPSIAPGRIYILQTATKLAPWLTCARWRKLIVIGLPKVHQWQTVLSYSQETSKCYEAHWLMIPKKLGCLESSSHCCIHKALKMTSEWPHHLI